MNHLIYKMMIGGRTVDVEEPAADAQFIGMGDATSADGVLALPVPDGTEAGDVIVVAIMTRGDRAISPPSGWTQVPTGVMSGYNLVRFRKEYDPGESLDFLVDPAGAAHGFISSYRGSWIGSIEGQGSNTMVNYTPETPRSIVGAIIFASGPLPDPLTATVGDSDNMDNPLASIGGYLSSGEYFYVISYGYTSTTGTELGVDEVVSEIIFDGSTARINSMFEIGPPGA